MREYITNSAEETQKVAGDLAKTLKGGEIFILSGDLGAGKTTFIQGLAEGLGVKNSVTSPTFVLMKQYNAENNLKLVHIDCYRVDADSHRCESGSAQIKFSANLFKEELGLDEIFEDKRNVVAAEWGERIASILPKNIARIEFGYLGGNKRLIKF